MSANIGIDVTKDSLEWTAAPRGKIQSMQKPTSNDRAIGEGTSAPSTSSDYCRIDWRTRARARRPIRSRRPPGGRCASIQCFEKSTNTCAPTANQRRSR